MSLPQGATLSFTSPSRGLTFPSEETQDRVEGPQTKAEGSLLNLPLRPQEAFKIRRSSNLPTPPKFTAFPKRE